MSAPRRGHEASGTNREENRSPTRETCARISEAPYQLERPWPGGKPHGRSKKRGKLNEECTRRSRRDQIGATVVVDFRDGGGESPRLAAGGVDGGGEDHQERSGALGKSKRSF